MAKRLTTDNGIYDAEFAWATAQDTLLIQLGVDAKKRLPEVAQEFDGLQNINYINDDVGVAYEWNGFSVLDMIQRLPDNVIQMRLKKPKN